ncbi:MAG: cytochrome c [Alphaproteobacteria bacterium]|nr:cytochrome c [Alphaproteobacteria bacterium]
MSWRIVAVVLALACVVLSRAQAQEAILTVADRGSTRTYTERELLARADVQTVTIADPVYGRAMTYRAVPVTDLLSGLKIAADDDVQTRATDNFSIGIPVRLLLESKPAEAQAFIAIEDPAAPWPPLPKQGTASAGPFYLIWKIGSGARISSEYWAYHLAALTVVDGPLERWPALAVGAEVPANDPVRIGLQRYLEVCIACHRFKGAGEGEQGPDLGQPMNPVQYFQLPALKQLIRNPASLRHWPDMKMPGFAKSRLSDSDVDAIVAWLAYKAKQR